MNLKPLGDRVVLKQLVAEETTKSGIVLPGQNKEKPQQAFTEKSDILNGYIVPEYEVLHTQSKEYIVDDLLNVMKERGVNV